MKFHLKKIRQIMVKTEGWWIAGCEELARYFAAMGIENPNAGSPQFGFYQRDGEWKYAVVSKLKTAEQISLDDYLEQKGEQAETQVNEIEAEPVSGGVEAAIELVRAAGYAVLEVDSVGVPIIPDYVEGVVWNGEEHKRDALIVARCQHGYIAPAAKGFGLEFYQNAKLKTKLSLAEILREKGIDPEAFEIINDL